MTKKTMVKLVSALLCVLMVASVFTGCTKKNSANLGTDADQVLTYNLGAEPDTIDPALNEAVDGGNVINACFEGLTRIGKDLQVKPGVAKDWKVSDDGTVYTFNLRKDAKWSDGTPVTAKDFEYAWKRVLDPATKAPYVTMLFYVKNGQNYYEGKAKAEEVGIKVINDYKIEVTLEAPTAYFLELTAFATYMPVKKEKVDADKEKWARNPASYIGNGPFVLTDWKNNEAMEFEKNKNYWDAENVKLSKMTWVMVVEATPALGNWEKGDIDYMESPPAAQMDRLKSQNKLTTFNILGTYYVLFNNNKTPFNDPRVRKAFNLAYGRQPLIDAALKGGQKPAGAFIPYGIFEADGKTVFRDKTPTYFKPEGDIAEAQKLLADAGYPGGKDFPKIVYLYNTSEGHKKIAEALQAEWKKNLGVTVELQNQDWNVFQKTRKDGNYDIARAGWLGDYADPMTFLDMFLSNSDQNDAKYNNKTFDDAVNAAKKETDKAKRMEFLHKAEDQMMADMPVSPIYYYVNNACIQPYLKDLIKTPTGMLYFDNVYIDLDVKNGKK